MKFIALIDYTCSDSFFTEWIKEKISLVNNECNKVELITFILKDGKALDTDTELLLNILLNESERCPVLLDEKTAFYYPEILKLQTSIVIFKDDTNVNGIQHAISHGARIDFLNKHLYDNNKENQLSVVEFSKYIASYEFYVYLAKVFFHEHNKFPLILLPRYIQLEANSIDDLVVSFEKRYELKENVNWETSANGIEFVENDILMKCQDTAIHTLGDYRLKSKTTKLSNRKV